MRIADVCMPRGNLPRQQNRLVSENGIESATVQLNDVLKRVNIVAHIYLKSIDIKESFHNHYFFEKTPIKISCAEDGTQILTFRVFLRF